MDCGYALEHEALMPQAERLGVFAGWMNGAHRPSVTPHFHPIDVYVLSL